jgi:BirA family biotin operon repressor/biotin-[acetyl-CoA-carboxylase] ligase
LAESSFDRARFFSRLATRRLGRVLVARATVGSTNDEVWEACAAGAAHGTAIVADAQTCGRGRAGRVWHTAAGKALALSVALHRDGGRGPVGVLPLAAGLAVARALERLGAVPELKWPNDVLLAGGKVAGVLCESRRLARTDAAREVAARTGDEDGTFDAVVVGVGINVGQALCDFPPEIAGSASSLALAGVATDRETVAAEFLNALEPLWEDLDRGATGTWLEAWGARARFWGRPVVVRTPAGEVRGIARALRPDGALRIAGPDGAETAVLAGDLELPRAEAGS